MGRRAVMLGAVAATTVLTVRPALAQTAGSVMQCRIQVPEPAKAGQYIAADGSVVPAGTQGAYAGKVLEGRDVAQALKGSTLPGTTAEQSSAYIKYIQRLQAGQPGFSCYASLRATR